jgi:hypothetical protein
MAYQTNPDRTISAILATCIFFNLLILGHYSENKSPSRHHSNNLWAYHLARPLRHHCGLRLLVDVLHRRMVLLRSAAFGNYSQELREKFTSHECGL